MSINKKGSKIAVLSVIALLGLTACNETSEIYSKPSNYDDPIISIDGNEDDIHHNVLSIIYDAMHDGSLTSNVLDKSLYNFASSVFGYYNDVTAPTDYDGVTLKEAAEDVQANAGYAKAIEFIKAHKSYWYYNEEGQHVKEDGEGNVTPLEDGEDWTPGLTELSHVTAKWNAIESRIAEEMFSRISGSSYTTKNYFSEKEFLRSLRESGESVVNYKDINTFEKFIIPYTVEEDEVFDEFEGYDNANHVILHREYYQSSVSDDANAPEAKFIEEKIIPEVYNDLLIEQYLLDEDIAAVRNSRARQINVIKIEKYSSFTNNADLLVKKLVEEIYELPVGATSLETDADIIEADGRALFEKYSLIAKGLYDEISADPDAAAIVADLQEVASDIYEVDTKQGFSFYKNTTYGDLVEDYDEILNAASYEELGDTKYSSFTSSGTRSVLEGFEQQKIDIMQQQNITKGWYIQSSTPSLDSNGTINDRLFKLSVANAKIELNSDTDEAYESLAKADRLVYDGAWAVRDEASEFENKFLCSINGTYYLKFDGQSTTDDWKNDIVYDDGSAYYIVQVVEAAKDSKLRNVSDSNYAHTRSQVAMDKIIDEVAKIVGKTGSYASLSKEHWLEKMDLKYHDQVVYDYFESNYPDLFD